MIKTYNFPEKKEEMTTWLHEHLGPENGRWWIIESYLVYPPGGHGFKLWLDLTEEEEPMLSMLILKFI